MAEESCKFGIDTTPNPKENVETILDEAGLTLGELRLEGKMIIEKYHFSSFYT